MSTPQDLPAASTVRVELLPMGGRLEVAAGTPLQDILFEQGVEFPCGGRGRCKGCRVKVLDGALPATTDDLRVLSPEELALGWRLACRAQANGDLRIELAQWEAQILSDDSAFHFTPGAGLGIAIDLGTTTLVAQLLDLETAEVLGVRTALNAQAQHGADIMSRVELAARGEPAGLLTRLIRAQLGELVADLVRASGHKPLCQVVLVGNTVMHHLFCGLDVAPLAAFPFEPTQHGLQRFEASELEWPLRDNPAVDFLPCLGGFVGSDLLAGIRAVKLHESDKLAALVDLGTNGEIVVGDRNRLVCASTAAGPAFEGARISMGMRAATGAIAAVSCADGQLACRVLGHVPARGICGSGLVDAVAAGLDLGRIQPNGRLAQGSSFPLCDSVLLTQADIRELQLAKGAIAAGLRLLLQCLGRSVEDVDRIHLAGAFGNYISRRSAQRIGLLPLGPERVLPAGNTALLGAKLALFTPPDQDAVHQRILDLSRHVSLSEDPRFQEAFAEDMGFPELGSPSG